MMKNWFLLIGLALATSTSALATPIVQVTAVSDLITGCEGRELAHNSDYQAWIDQAVAGLQTSANDKCLGSARQVSAVSLDGTCGNDAYFRGTGHVAATASFECVANPVVPPVSSEPPVRCVVPSYGCCGGTWCHVIGD